MGTKLAIAKWLNVLNSMKGGWKVFLLTLFSGVTFAGLSALPQCHYMIVFCLWASVENGERALHPL